MGMILLIFLTFVGFGRSLENRCLNFAHTKSLQAVSFCKNETVISNRTVLDAFQPAFGYDSTHCMCEVKILSSLSTSSLYIKEETSLIPVGNCGLEVKLENASHNLDTVTCAKYFVEELVLRKDSTLVLTLTNTSVNFLNGFCFTLSLRFESSPISARCFSPGITSVPTLPTPSLETTTSGYVSETTSSLKPETTTSTKTTSTKAPSTQSIAESSSETPKSTSVTPISETVSTTTTNSDKQSSTTTVVAGLTDQVTSESDSTTTAKDTVNTPGGSVSSTEGDTATSVAMEVRDATDFNVLYVIIPVLALLLIGIFSLIVIWYKRQNDNKGNAYRQERLQSSVPSSLDTDNFNQRETGVKTTNNSNNTSGMKEEPSFFFLEDQHIQEPVSDIYAKPKPKPGRYANKHQSKAVAQKETNQDGKMTTNSRSRAHDPNVVYVTVNGGERFAL